MSYKFYNTANGPLVVSEDKAVFIYESGNIQQFSEEFPGFIDDATGWLKEQLITYADLIVNAIDEVTIDHENMNAFSNLYVASNSIKHIKQQNELVNGFPGSNPLIN